MARTKVDPNVMYDVLEAFVRKARSQYGSDSFAAGYLQSSLVRVLEMLPKHKQQEFLSGIWQSSVMREE